MDFIESLNPTLAVAFVIGGPIIGLVAGIIALIGVFDKSWKTRQNEKDGLEDDVRDLYKTKVGEQDKKIEDLTSKVATLQSGYDTVSAENKTMRDIFQGRDQETVKYRRRGLQTMELANKMGESIFSQAAKTDAILKGMNKQTEAIVRLAKSVERTVNKKQ